MGRPLPDPTEQNKNIRLFDAAMKKVAEKRSHPFVDFYEDLPDGSKAKPPAPLTDNGIHLTPHGYWRSALVLQQGPASNPLLWAIDIDPSNKMVTSVGTTAICLFDKDGPRKFTVRDDALPVMPADRERAETSVPASIRRLHVHGLGKGNFTLTIDGTEITTATAKEWADGVTIQGGPDYDQAEKLRAAIIEKNRLYFHRWRPQNETYLFGFRKGEQGQNGVEIPKFDPFIAKQEELIAKLRVPVEHTYELKAQRKEGDK